MTDAGEPQAAPETSGSLAVGDVVADRYRVDAVLGEGGMGIVYRAQHLHLRKPFALKVTRDMETSRRAFAPATRFRSISIWAAT
jgi:serine/threonine protein kinase